MTELVSGMDGYRSAEELVGFKADPDVVVYEAVKPGDVMRIRREVEGRQWAESHGLPTAQTLAVGPGDRWMVSRRVTDEPGETMDYLGQALELTLRIQGLPEPVFRTRGATWRAPRRSVPVRAARLIAAGVSPRDFVATRSAAERLAPDATVHNDYHRNNVLNTSTTGGVTVVDWEYTARGPRHHDFARLLVDVRDDALAHQGWELFLAAVPRAEHRDVAAQLQWLALRTYASEVGIPRALRQPERGLHFRKRWLQTLEWTQGWSS